MELKELKDLVKVLKKSIKAQRTVKSAIEELVEKELLLQKSAFEPHVIDVGDAFAEEFQAKVLAEKNTEEIKKVAEEEIQSPKDVPSFENQPDATGLN